MSAPAPPSSKPVKFAPSGKMNVSLPPCPVRVSFPPRALIWLATLSPVKMSSKTVPMMFSIPVTVPKPVAVPAKRLTFTAEP